MSERCPFCGERNYLGQITCECGASFEDSQKKIPTLSIIEEEKKLQNSLNLDKTYGKVKWFSIEKGYGFICGDDLIDRFFSVKDLEGFYLPVNGDVVSFKDGKNNKGPRASNVKIFKKNLKGVNFDDRILCSYCGKRIVPRIITYQGVPQKSVCPFCGKVVVKFVSSYTPVVVFFIILFFMLLAGR